MDRTHRLFDKPEMSKLVLRLSLGRFVRVGRGGGGGPGHSHRRRPAGPLGESHARGARALTPMLREYLAPRCVCQHQQTDAAHLRTLIECGLPVPFPGAGHLMMVTEPKKAADAITLCNVAT
jgi:hypothetical protein